MDDTRAAHGQSRYALRLDWGPTGADAIRDGCGAAVVVDVLSFTTTLTVAADLGVVVFPFRWRDARAERFARDHDAVLAAGRSTAGPGRVSLSPPSLRAATGLHRLVLPSPNGSTISAGLAGSGTDVLGASLRNRSAVADALTARCAAEPGLRVAVVAAGERWGDGSLRPAVEDLWGVGAVIALLCDAGWPDVAPEARAAAAAFQDVADDVGAALHDCAGGRELAGIGFGDDVRVAAELDDSRSVPRLRGAAFRPD